MILFWWFNLTIGSASPRFGRLSVMASQPTSLALEPPFGNKASTAGPYSGKPTVTISPDHHGRLFRGGGCTGMLGIVRGDWLIWPSFRNLGVLCLWNPSFFLEWEGTSCLTLFAKNLAQPQQLSNLTNKKYLGVVINGHSPWKMCSNFNVLTSGFGFLLWFGAHQHLQRGVN